MTEYIHAIIIPSMEWVVEYTNEFEAWWNTLSEKEQTAVAVTVGLLERMRPALPFPHSSAVHGSRHGHMRELRTQCDGHPLRTLYAFDPRRVAILLIGGDKTGDNRWYELFVPLADRLYAEHLQEIASEKAGTKNSSKEGGQP
ncbi:type II toxin-antitoxin system RelE/ParE family toxin [Desulfovibrio sp. OttesenSCG-928-O18]|nr:type II toxin-antitoxin system RelE/ParE family toxin [Desulfovibrio sp. OttesenSCG-928-O18]